MRCYSRKCNNPVLEYLNKLTNRRQTNRQTIFERANTKTYQHIFSSLRNCKAKIQKKKKNMELLYVEVDNNNGKSELCCIKHLKTFPLCKTGTPNRYIRDKIVAQI